MKLYNFKNKHNNHLILASNNLKELIQYTTTQQTRRSKEDKTVWSEILTLSIYRDLSEATIKLSNATLDTIKALDKASKKKAVQIALDLELSINDDITEFTNKLNNNTKQ